MYTLQIIIDGNKNELISNDSMLEIPGVMSIPYENIVNMDYKKGGLMSKSKITIDYLDNGYQNVFTVNTNEKYNSCIRFINFVEEKIANIQNQVRQNDNNMNTNMQNNYLNNYQGKPEYSIKVANGPIKGTLEIYENYIKVVYNNNFNVIYYNQMIKAEKIKQSPSAFIIFVLRTDMDEIFEHEWLVDKLFTGNKVNKIIDYVNNKITQCNANNDIQVINVLTNPKSNNRIFFMGSISERKSSLIGGRTTQNYAIIAYLMEDYLLIQKLALFSKDERGDKKIPYERITSIDYDKPTTFGISSGIDITLSGSDVVSLESVYNRSSENFYKMLTKVVEKNRKQQPTQIIHQETTSNADELLKWHELYEKGVISEEEFNQKKKELL